MIGNFLRSRFFLLSLAVVCFASAFYISGRQEPDFSTTAARFENILNRKEQHSKKELSELAEKTKKWKYKELFSEKPGYYESLFDREGLVFLIFENDTLRFWTDNTVAVDNRLSRNNFKDPVVKLPNGWFEVVKLSVGKKELFALILLKREYVYQNKYLANEFQREFNISREVEIKIDPDKMGQKQNNAAAVSGGDIYEKEKGYLCSLIFPSSSSGSTSVFCLTILLNILGLFFALWFLHAECGSLSDNIGKGWAALLLVVSVAMLRYLCIIIHFPQVFYETKLFSPELYGDASYRLLGSLGDLLISVLLVFYLTYYLYRKIATPSRAALPAYGSPKGGELARESELRSQPSVVLWGGFRRGGWVSFLLLLLVFLASRVINYVFAGLINNSSIPFTLNDIFSQNIYTYLCLVIVGLFFISYLFLLDITAGLFKQLSGKNKFIISLSAVIIFVAFSHLLGTLDMILVF